jgi:hypothetical protein
MTSTYDLNTNGCLILKADAVERESIKQMVADHGCDYCGQCEANALESLIANSELEWIRPEEIGALTSAPILGIYGNETELPANVKHPEDLLIIGRWDGKTWYQPVSAAWGFMDYAVRSFLQDLIEDGKAVFIS